MNNTLTAVLPVVAGYAIHKLYVGKKRNIGSRNTPPKFKVKFWIEDNALSALSHMALWWAIIQYTHPILEAANGFSKTPEIVKEVLNLLPISVWLFVFGFLSAYPFSVLEKKLRPLKNRFGFAKG